ncbi:MAG: ribonuclease H-like domain-containing protein [Promethearchaeota archaeon]
MRYLVSDEILEKYRDKDLMEVFPNSEVIKTEYGEFLKINDLFGDFNKELITLEDLKLCKLATQVELSIVKGIGIKTEKSLRKKRIQTLNDLIGISNKKYIDAQRISMRIENSDPELINELPKVKSEYLISCFDLKDFLFIDIETTGLNDANIFLIGLGYFESENKFKTDLLLAREIAEEMAIVKYFFDIMDNFRVFVSYNGKLFDIPFLIGRIHNLLDKEEIEEKYNKYKRDKLVTQKNSYKNGEEKKDLMEKNNIEEKDSKEMISEIFNSFYHIDLLPICRRFFSKTLPSFSLEEVEQNILDFYRDENLNSSFVPQVYKDWLDEPKKYMGGLYKVVEHNYYDIINLQGILKEIIYVIIQGAYQRLNYRNLNKYEKSADLAKKLQLVKNKSVNVEKMINELKKVVKKSKSRKVSRIDDFCI